MGSGAVVMVRVLSAGLLAGGGLVVGGCTSDTEGSAGSAPASATAPADAAESTVAPASTAAAEEDPAAGVVAAADADAELIVGHLGSEPAAMAAVLLARDRGYGVEQIVGAGAAGRLQADGQIVAEDGTVVVPGEPATEVFADDATEGAQPAGFRSRTARSLQTDSISISEFVARAEAFGETHGYPGLALLLMAMRSGYSLDQIVTHILADDALGFVDVSLDSTPEFVFYDDGSVVVPSRNANRTDSTDAEEPPPPTDPPTTDPPAADPRSTDATRPSDDDASSDTSASALIDRAIGVYPVTADLGQHLEGLGDVISVTPPDGEFVVEPDGTVRGSLVYTIQQGYEGEVTLTTLWDRTFQEADLVVLDDGLTFETDVMLIISWDGQDPTEYTEVATGLLDVDIGQLVITGLTELDSVRFEKQPSG